MKVLVAAASHASNLSGVQRHAVNLARCLLSQPSIESVHFVIAPWQRSFMEAASASWDARLITYVSEMKRHSPGRNAWYYRELPGLAARLGVDLVHLCCPMPVNASALPCATVVTLHDLYPFEIPMNFGFPKFIVNRLVLRQCLKAIDAVACVSNATMLGLLKYFPDVRQKAIRIYNCVDAADLAEGRDPVEGWNGAPFLLAVAQHRRNKNLPLLLRSMDLLLRSEQVSRRMQLLVVGIQGPETGKLYRLVAKYGLSQNIRFLEGLSDAELAWCYRYCEALIAPSVTEGFGLSIAEGLLAGCRIVCSDIPAHREIGGDRCMYIGRSVDPESALADAICGALKEPKPRPIALPQLSVPVIGKQYLGLYQRLVNAAPKESVEKPGERTKAYASSNGRSIAEHLYITTAVEDEHGRI